MYSLILKADRTSTHWWVSCVPIIKTIIQLWCVCVCVYVCVCVCVYDERERESVCVCVCVCVLKAKRLLASRNAHSNRPCDKMSWRWQQWIAAHAPYRASTCWPHDHHETHTHTWAFCLAMVQRCTQICFCFSVIFTSRSCYLICESCVHST